jgi:hypothetical protein
MTSGDICISKSCKNSSQVNHLEKYLIASGDIETGVGKKGPIGLFGFLY